jgi:hypothetical protein
MAVDGLTDGHDELFKFLEDSAPDTVSGDVAEVGFDPTATYA